jgi:hypothetical protein
MSKFKIGDRVVVVRVSDQAIDLVGTRGKIDHIRDSDVYEFPIELESTGNLFKEDELEFEHIYDALSAKPEIKVFGDEESGKLTLDMSKASGSIFLASKVETRPDEGRGETTSGDLINHPSHYADGWSNGAEVIDITEHLNFNRGNAVKYLSRAGKKGAPEKELEDLQKALWYVTREVQRLGGSVD